MNIDELRMDFINSLPQPFLVRLCGDKTSWWPVNDFEVASGMMRIDVCGILEVRCFSEVMEIKDGDHVAHDPDTFWTDPDSEEDLAYFLDRFLSTDPDLQSLSITPAVEPKPQQTGRVVPMARPVTHQEERG